MKTLTLTDPGYHDKEVEFDGTEEGFMASVRADEGRYHDAMYTPRGSKVRFFAWRPLGSDVWTPGSFMGAVKEACQKLGFKPGLYRVQIARDNYDEKGMTLAEIAADLQNIFGQTAGNP